MIGSTGKMAREPVGLPLPRRTVSLIVAATVLLSILFAALPVADEAGREHVDDAFRRALVAGGLR